MSRRKFTAKFKTKVVLEALKEQDSMTALAQKHELHPTQISIWKKEFLSNASTVFGTEKPNSKTEKEQREEMLLKTIGELKVENDYLKKNLK